MKKLDRLKITELEKKANEIRKNIVEEVYHAKSGHPGGSLYIFMK